MVSIYERFPKELIHVNDDYSSQPAVHILKDVRFQVDLSKENDFLTPVGLVENKIQSILNKQFYYVPEQMKATSGVEYSLSLQKTYMKLLQYPREAFSVIEEPVFYCMDFESINSTVHSYDILFYLLYIYKTSGLPCRLLIPKSTNPYFLNTIQLFKTYYAVEFLELDYERPYLLRSLYCVRTYMNTLFLEVKEFINQTLIDPILKKYEDLSPSQTVAKLKILPRGSIRSANAVFPYSSEFSELCSAMNISLFDEDTPEDLKIYYINKAKNILVCWGSIFYIYIDYYLKRTNDTFISVLFHKGMMSERGCLVHHEGFFYQQINHHDRNYQQVYNTLRFEGEVIDSIETLHEYKARSILFKS